MIFEEIVLGIYISCHEEYPMERSRLKENFFRKINNKY